LKGGYFADLVCMRGLQNTVGQSTSLQITRYPSRTKNETGTFHTIIQFSWQSAAEDLIYLVIIWVQLENQSFVLPRETEAHGSAHRDLE